MHYDNSHSPSVLQLVSWMNKVYYGFLLSFNMQQQAFFSVLLKPPLLCACLQDFPSLSLLNAYPFWALFLQLQVLSKVIFIKGISVCYFGVRQLRSSVFFKYFILHSSLWNMKTTVLLLGVCGVSFSGKQPDCFRFTIFWIKKKK